MEIWISGYRVRRFRKTDERCEERYYGKYIIEIVEKQRSFWQWENPICIFAMKP